MRKTPLLAAALALLAGTAARADTVEVTSTTFLTASQQTRGGAAGEKPDLTTVVPAYEVLSISAQGIKTGFADDVRIVLNTWGSIELDDHRWDNGTGGSTTGDVMTGYVQGQLFARHLQLRIGREHVMTGVARALQIDGGEAILVLPAGFRVSGYAGAPVAQRFTSRTVDRCGSASNPCPPGVPVGSPTSQRSWNPTGGDLAYGGRLGWSLPLDGVPGRGLDLGASVNMVQNGKDPVRQEAGADLRFQPLGNLTFAAMGAYSLYDARFSEANAAVTWTVVRPLHLTADWRFVAPDLLLARNSILSVFSTAERNEFGGGLTYDFARGLHGGLDYHLQVEPGRTETAASYLGHDARARLDWERGDTVAGVEGLYLNTLENGYWAARAYGRRELGRLFVAADVLAHFFREAVNGEKQAVTGQLTAGVNLAAGWSAVVAGRAGFTPFMEQTYDVMAKLVYNQTYRMREVR